MWQSYNLGWRIVRLRVQHLLSDYGWLTYPNSHGALIKGYSGCRGYTLILIVSEPFPLWSVQLEMSVIKIQRYSLSQEMGALGSLHTAPDTSWEELRGRRGGALSFSLFFVYPPLCITVPLKRAAGLWSVYPCLCQSKLVSWRLHSSALQYLCLLPCLRFLMTEPIWVKLEGMQMGSDVLWAAPALCVTITSHTLSSLNIAVALWCIALWITRRDANSLRMSWMSLICF